MKKLSLIAILLLMLVLTLSCSKEGIPEESDLPFRNDEGDVILRIIYPEEGGTALTEAVSEVKRRITAEYGVSVDKLTTDSLTDNSDYTEILIGQTNRDASTSMTETLRANEFFIGVYEGKFLICGCDESATVKAMSYFYDNCEKFAEDDSFIVAGNYFYEYEYDQRTVTLGGTDISEYTIVYEYNGGTYAEVETWQKYSAQRLQEQISQLCGKIIPVINDSEEESEYEIIIGAARDGEDYDEDYGYSITLDGKKLYITAGSTYAYTKAYDTLLSDEVDSGYTASAENVLKATKTEKFEYMTESLSAAPVSSVEILGADLSEYTIVYHDYGKKYSGIGMHEQRAAEELQKYLKYATGIELPLVLDSEKETEREILVGNTDRTDVDSSVYGVEGLLIKAEGTKLVLCGGEERGSLYAVYTFLEEYIGCEFFSGDCEVVYYADEVVIPDGLYDEQFPDMEFRDVSESAAQDTTYAVKRKLNSFYCRSFNYYTGGSYEFSAGLVHTMTTIFGVGNVNSQPCFTDEEVYQKTLKKAKSLLASNHDCEVISVTQNDNNNYCSCAECYKVYVEEGSWAGPLIRFINRLAGDLKEDYPDVKVLTLAYMFSYEAPKTSPADNVIIELCSLDACCGCSLGDISCSKNAEFRKNLENWTALTDNLYVWYYIIDFTHNNAVPFMNFDSIYETYQLYANNGVIGAFNEGNVHDDSEFGVLRSYLLSKLMWNTDMTREEYDDCIGRFIAAYYGEASDLVEEYFYMSCEISDNRHFTQYTDSAAIFNLNRFSPIIDELDEWWTKMLSFDYSNEAVLQHIENIYTGYETLRTAATR